MADPVISVKLIVLYRFLSHNFPRSKTMWFLANSSIWHTKMLLNLTIPHPTTSFNVFLSQFPSFSSCLEQRTVQNTREPFLVLFSFMKEQVFVPKTPNIFAIMTGPPSTIVKYFTSYNPTEKWLQYHRIVLKDSKGLGNPSIPSISSPTQETSGMIDARSIDVAQPI